MYRYCTEASNQISKYAYRKIFFYKKALLLNITVMQTLILSPCVWLWTLSLTTIVDCGSYSEQKRKTKGSELSSLSEASTPSWCQQVHIFPLFLLLSHSPPFRPSPPPFPFLLSSCRMHFYVLYLAVPKCSILHSFSCQFWWHFINWTAKADDPSHLHSAQLHYLS